MNLKFYNKKISGILSILPKSEYRFDDEIENYNFSKEKCLQLKKIMGYNKHRIVGNNVCVSDLLIFGLDYLFRIKLLDKNDIDALILVTQSPDYFMPPTSNVIQGKLNLKHDLLCMDINQGCAGYLIGLIQSFMLLEQEEINKIVLLNGDILSKKTSKQDRNSYPLVGDAAAVTIIEKDSINNSIYANLKMDGSRSNILMIPAGGFKMPSTEDTKKMRDVGDNNFRSLENLTMKGSEIFNFVQTEVPVMIEELLELSNITKNKIDYFMFHQPNKFMLEKLADKMKISYKKMPNNIVENYGNASGVTIPLNITHNLSNKLLNNVYTLCLAGFGVGLTWSSMILRMGSLDFCKMIEY